MNAGRPRLGHGRHPGRIPRGSTWPPASAGRSPAGRLRPAYRTTTLTASDVVVSGHVPAGTGGPGRGRGRHRRDRPVAAGQPARRGQRRIGLHQPARGLGRPPDRRVRAQGPADRDGGGLRQARQLHPGRPGGSADDVLAVIDQVRAHVAEATGMLLRTEVRLVGFRHRPGVTGDSRRSHSRRGRLGSDGEGRAGGGDVPPGDERHQVLVRDQAAHRAGPHDEGDRPDQGEPSAPLRANGRSRPE